MPGPMSAPNGDRRLLLAAYREAQRAKGALRTGKTAKRSSAKPPRPRG